MKTVVIIGAGFSGTATAINLLRSCTAPLKVVLVNRSGSMARGLAYGTSSPQHLLNVPAGNMSVLADDSDDFLRFCRGRIPGVSADSFVSRQLYGDYLGSRLDEAELSAAPLGKLIRLSGEARRIQREGPGARVEMADGLVMRADHVVLAFGHFAPRNPRNLDPRALGGSYLADPWASGGMRLPAGGPVLLVGSGLTALDVVTSLLQQGHRDPIHMVSRRGLMPLPHRTRRSEAPVPDSFLQDMLQAPPAIRSYMRVLRRKVELLQQQGVDWRDLIGALRPVTAQLWQRLPMAEKQRFLRHVQPFWDVHRHRVAPDSWELFRAALAQGQIRPLAGRVVASRREGDRVQVTLRLRGGGRELELDVARILNCTGPNGNPALVDDELIRQLMDDGLLQADALGLGVAVNERLALLGRAGEPVSCLSYVGPMLKGRLWEATAVPELRQHAAWLADRLLTPAPENAAGNLHGHLEWLTAK